MQVDPIKPKLKPPGTKRLNLNCDVLLSTYSFNLNLRRYIEYAAMFRELCTGYRQELTLVHFSAQPKPFWSTSHLPVGVSTCLIDWGKIMHSIYPTKCVYVE